MASTTGTAPRTSAERSTPRSAANAFKGIQLYCLAELPALPAGMRPVVSGNYKLYPALVRHEDAGDSVAYWIAYNTQTKRNEFVVGPDELTRFTGAVELFEAAAVNAYMQGEPNKWQLESMKAIDAAVRDGPAAAFGHLGRAWLAAIKDPSWWMQNAAAVGGMAGNARNAGRVRVPNAQAAGKFGSSTPIVPGGGLRAHEGGAANGHLIAKHVSKVDARLVERANTSVTRSNGRTCPPPARVSAFFERATAEVAASQTIAANESGIVAWLEGKSPRLTIQNPTRAAPVGRSVQRYSSEVKDVAGAELVLIRDSSMPGGFRILTGYPIP